MDIWYSPQMPTPVEKLRLTDQAAEAIQAANRLVHRDIALQNLRYLLDPEARLSTWGFAGVISDRLRHFQATAWPHIAKGYREPRGALEAALLLLCKSDCPASQRRLFPILADLRL